MIFSSVALFFNFYGMSFEWDLSGQEYSGEKLIRQYPFWYDYVNIFERAFYYGRRKKYEADTLPKREELFEMW